MNIKHLTSDTLRSLLELTEKKEQLIKAVADVETQIAKAVGGTTSAVLDIAEAVTPFKPAAPAKGRRGASTKDRILALLEAAGDQGLRVRDIARQLGAKGTSISVWFATTGKDLTTRVSPGIYKLGQSSTSAAPAKPATKAATKAKSKGKPKAAAKAKAPKPAAKAPVAKPADKKKKTMSPEARAKIAAAAKARWSKIKAEKSADKKASQ